MAEKRNHNVEMARKGPNLRGLDYSPEVNPLLEGTVIPMKKSQVRTGFNSKHLVDPESGELTANTTGTSTGLHTIRNTSRWLELTRRNVKRRGRRNEHDYRRKYPRNI
jgi:hypothetical protein